MIEHVKDIKALIDAAKPFIDALPKGHHMARIVGAYVDAERLVAGKLVHSDMWSFDAAASVAMDHGDEMVDYYAELSDICESLPKPTFDSTDGCEND